MGEFLCNVYKVVRIFPMGVIVYIIQKPSNFGWFLEDLVRISVKYIMYSIKSYLEKSKSYPNLGK